MARQGELLMLGQNAHQSIAAAGEKDIAVNFIIRPEFFSGTLPFLGKEETPLRSFITGCLTGKNEAGYLHFHVAELLPIQNLIENLLYTLSEREFTRTLWQMCTECIVVFPDGVNVLPWMLCGTNEIGQATAEEMLTARLVVWALHGLYGAGKDLDETFGLIETAEKAAEIYMKIAHLPRVNTITDDMMHQLEKRFGVRGRDGYLE